MDNELIMVLLFLAWMVVLPAFLVVRSRRRKARNTGLGSLAGLLTIFTLGE